MKPRRRQDRRPELPVAPATAVVRAPAGTGVAITCMALAVFVVPLAVDSRAEASFDAPKRLLALLSIGAAALALLSRPGNSSPRRRGERLAGSIAILGAALVCLALAAAVSSPHRDVALDAARAAMLFAWLPIIGADRAFIGRGGQILLAAFLGSSLVNALVSILQATGRAAFYVVETRSGRQDTGAFLGNEGHLSITLALAGVAALSWLSAARGRGSRLTAVSILLACGTALVLNRNLTTLTAVAAGAAAVAGLQFRRRAIPFLTLVLVALVGIGAFVGPVRDRAAAAIADARNGEWDRLLTYRLGPWAAALEMIRARPLLGFGPGTFEAEFLPHRLVGEIRHRTRFLNPTTASSYGEAHSEYLQLGAELGVPALLAALSALAALLWGTVRVALRDGPNAAEARLLAAVLISGSVMALTWFPLQQTPSLLPLGLAAGRAWALIAEGERS